MKKSTLFIMCFVALIVMCIIFTEAFCINDDDGKGDQQMLDNIANVCPDNLSYNDIVWANSASDNCLCAIRFYMENCLNENNDPISPDSATRFDALFGGERTEINYRPVSFDFFRNEVYNELPGGKRYISPDRDLRCTKVVGPIAPRHRQPSENHPLCNNQNILDRFQRFSSYGWGYDNREICVDSDATDPWGLCPGGQIQSGETWTKEQCLGNDNCATIHCP